MTTPAAILNSLNPNSQSEAEVCAEGAHKTTDALCIFGVMSFQGPKLMMTTLARKIPRTKSQLN